MAIENLTETVLARVTASEKERLLKAVDQRSTTVSRLLRKYIRRLKVKK